MELNPKVYAQHAGLTRIEVDVCKFILAYAGKIPSVWCELIGDKWYIHNGSRKSYFFKVGSDAGLFGWTDDPEDRLENGFDNANEAIECFKKYYSFLEQ